MVWVESGGSGCFPVWMSGRSKFGDRLELWFGGVKWKVPVGLLRGDVQQAAGLRREVWAGEVEF